MAESRLSDPHVEHTPLLAQSLVSCPSISSRRIRGFLLVPEGLCSNKAHPGSCPWASPFRNGGSVLCLLNYHLTPKNEPNDMWKSRTWCGLDHASEELMEDMLGTWNLAKRKGESTIQAAGSVQYGGRVSPKAPFSAFYEMKHKAKYGQWLRASNGASSFFPISNYCKAIVISMVLA